MNVVEPSVARLNLLGMRLATLFLFNGIALRLSSAYDKIISPNMANQPTDSRETKIGVLNAYLFVAKKVNLWYICCDTKLH